MKKVLSLITALALMFGTVSVFFLNAAADDALPIEVKTPTVDQSTQNVSFTAHVAMKKYGKKVLGAFDTTCEAKEFSVTVSGNGYSRSIPMDITSVYNTTNTISANFYGSLSGFPDGTYNYEWRVVHYCYYNGVHYSEYDDVRTTTGTITLKCSHSSLTYRKYIDTVNPTCTEEGYTKYHCDACGKDFKEDIKPAPGHFSVEDAAIPATCTTEGYSAGSHCGVCGITLTERTKVSDALGHNWNGGVITVSPTCAFPGEKLFTCQRCKTTKTETVQKLGHNWDGGIVTSDPTCTQQGVRTFTCSRCNGKETEQINALGHSYRDIVIAPTCTAKGYTKHECTRCAGFYCDTVTNPTGHSTLTGYTEVVPASCEGIGVEAQFCTKCGGVMALREKAATGHSEEIIPAVPATTQSEGLTQGVKCSICEKILVEQEIVPKIRPQQGETNQGSDTQASLGETEQKEQDTVFDILGVIKWIYENVISKIFSLFITGIQG